MRMYLDQMFRADFAHLLRAQGHDVERTAETGHARSDDEEILQYAITANRLLVTLDEHFGDWTVLPLRKHPGVIRLKIHPPLSANLADRLIPFLRNHAHPDFVNRLIILSPARERWIATSE